MECNSIYKEKVSHDKDFAIINIAGVYIAFPSVVFFEMPEYLKINYEISYKNKDNLGDIIRVVIHPLNQRPDLFGRIALMKNYGLSYECKEGVGYYYIHGNNNGKCFIFSYNKSLRLCEIYADICLPAIHLYEDRKILHWLFNSICDFALYAVLLTEYSGVLLHAAGLHRDGKGGMLVCGCSGEGKTTLTKHLVEHCGYDALSDDCVAIRLINQSLYMFSTPWKRYNNLGCFTQGVPIDKVFFLTKERGVDTKVTILPPREFLLRWHSYIRFSSLMENKTDVFTELSMAFIRQTKTSILSYVLGDNTFLLQT
ncbi:MAG: hypothetical protein NTV71_01400 [Candidatus Omnitrophica bacterium]|nr:hypothetical protein [Candidatus Omnitrophota bacterium]